MNKNETLPILFKNLYDVSAISIDSKLPIQILLGSNAELITKDGIGNFGYNTGEIFHTQYPIDYLGIEYVLLPNNKNNINSIFKEFYYKIVPIENNTEIKINNISKGIFNKQDYYIEYSTVPIVINSNKKISVTQYLTGRYEEEGTYYHESSKPNMVQLLPTNQMLKNLTFNLFHFRECINCNSNNQSNDSAFINILAYKDDDIFIDENKINGFINIDNSNFKYRSLNLDFGVHKITSQKGISVICYCQTSHYGFRRNNYFYNPQGTFINNKVNILLNDRFYRETICGNSPFILSADAPEEAVEFDWTINDTLKFSGKEVNLDLPKPGKYNIKLKIDNDDNQVYEWSTTRLEEIKSDLDSVIYLCNESLTNLTMNVSGGGITKSITWFPSENIKDPTQFNIEFINPLKESTKLFYEVIDEHCCTYLDSVDIQITNVYPKITTT